MVKNEALRRDVSGPDAGRARFVGLVARLLALPNRTKANPMSARMPMSNDATLCAI